MASSSTLSSSFRDSYNYGPSSSSSYFYAAGTSTYDDGHLGSRGGRSASISMSRFEVDIEPGWASAVDPKSGSVYYYHRKTRDVRWTPPRKNQKPEERESKLPVRGHKSASSSNAASSSSTSMSSETARPRRSAPTAPSSADSSNGKWENIREAVDVRTGMKYFYDRYTRETFWVDPRIDTRSMFDASTGLSSKRAIETRVNEKQRTIEESQTEVEQPVHQELDITSHFNDTPRAKRDRMSLRRRHCSRYGKTT